MVLELPEVKNNICYEKDFLREVIVRVDFDAKIPSLRTELPAKLRHVALEHFPLDEPQQAFAGHLDLQARQFATEEFTEHVFHGKDREKTLKINPEFLFVSYSKYDKYEALVKEFSTFVEVFSAEFADMRPKRLGMRFINSFEVGGEDPLDWTRYIHPDLLSAYTLRFPESEPVRLFVNNEYRIEDFNLRLQFGSPNPDYPSIIRSRQFVLDMDAYVRGLVEPNEIADYFDKFHKSIQSIFEACITDELRTEMGEVQDVE